MPSVEALKITVDQDQCSGCGVCEGEAPEAFEMNDDDQAVPKNPLGGDFESIMSAAEGCPTECITVVDTQAGKQLYPEA